MNSPLNCKNGDPESINVKVKLWTKENDAKLYDYESQTTDNKELDFNIEFPAAILQEGDLMKCVPYEQVENKGDIILLLEKTADGKVKLIPGEKSLKSKMEDKSFLVVRSVQKSSEEDQGFQLQPGNILKLGRCLMEVVEYRDSNLETYKKLDAESEKVVQSIPRRNYGITSENGMEQEICRICCDEDESQPLVSICKCKGSCRTVHWGCLRRWLCRNVVIKDHAKMSSHLYSRFECELCKDTIDRKYLIDGMEHEVFKLNIPQNDPYILLKCYESKEKVTSGVLHVIRMKENEIRKVGRANQCDIQIIEITVSREHAILKCQDDKFWLVDKNSKFGTLKLINEPMILNNEAVEVQIGRCLLTFTVQNKVWNPQTSNETQCHEQIRDMGSDERNDEITIPPKMFWIDPRELNSPQEMIAFQPPISLQNEVAEGEGSEFFNALSAGDMSFSPMNVD